MAKRKRGQKREIGINVDRKSLLHEVKFRISKRLRKFAESYYPMRHKLTGRDLYIDIDRTIDTIVVEGLTPNLSEIRGTTVKYDKRAKTEPHVYYGKNGFRRTDNKAFLTNPGVPVRETVYDGGGQIRSEWGVFGVTQDGEKRVYGLISEGEARPAYYYLAVPEWLASEQYQEVQRIITEVISEVMGEGITAT